MTHTLSLLLTVFFAFFAIMNPIAGTAVFAGLTGNLGKEEQRKIAQKALLTSFFVVFTFALLGKAIFHLFGITLPALRIAGGVLVFMIGYQMLHGEASKMHQGQASKDTDLAISPLAVPLLAGPGTIATAMNYSAAGGWADIALTTVTFAALCLITYLCFLSSSRIIALVGHSGLSIMTRLMGLILAVIGVQMLITGVLSVVKLAS